MTDAQREQVQEKIREHRLLAQLLDKAEADPTFAAALSRAAHARTLVATAQRFFPNPAR